MKPMPTSSMHCATCRGVSSTTPPSASSRSAAPDCEVIARLPCFATFAPAAAATNAAVVEALNTFLLEPPVPHVSRSGRTGVSTWSAASRIACAMPVSSSTVSPLVRNAVTNAPNCAAVARSPSASSRPARMMSRIASRASCSVRSRCSSMSAASASRITRRLRPSFRPPHAQGARGSCATGRVRPSS